MAKYRPIIVTIVYDCSTSTWLSKLDFLAARRLEPKLIVWCFRRLSVYSDRFLTSSDLVTSGRNNIRARINFDTGKIGSEYLELVTSNGVARMNSLNSLQVSGSANACNKLSSSSQLMIHKKACNVAVRSYETRIRCFEERLLHYHSESYGFIFFTVWLAKTINNFAQEWSIKRNTHFCHLR